MIWFRMPLSVVMVLSFLGACSPKTPEQKPVSGESREEEHLELSKGEKDRLIAFAEKYGEAMDEGDKEVLYASFNLDAMFDRTFQDVKEMDPERYEKVRALFSKRSRWDEGGWFGTYIGAPFDFLRLETEDSEPGLLYRSVQQGRANYVRMITQFDSEGEPEIVDVYMFFSGEKLSDLMRNAILPVFANELKTPLEKLFSGKPGPAIVHWREMTEMFNSLKAGDLWNYFRLHQSLPDSLKDEKVVMLSYLQASEKALDGSEKAQERYDGIVLKFKELYGDDPVSMMLGIEYHLVRKEYAKALEAVDRLDREVGGDPYLDTYRANISLASGDLDSALKYATRALDAMPGYSDTHLVISDVHFARKDWASLARCFKRIEEEFNYTFELKELPIYEEFLQSPHGKPWAAK